MTILLIKFKGCIFLREMNNLTSYALRILGFSIIDYIIFMSAIIVYGLN
jgi:hypothetical protein